MAVSRVVSIEITDLTTRICEMGYGKKNPTIYKSVIFDNPEYSIDDGFITDRIAFGNLLKDQMKNAGIKTKDIVFVLTSSKVVSREVTIPEMKEDIIGDLVENDRDEYFPMDTSDHVFTFHVIEHLKEDKTMRTMIFAAPEILLKNYQALAAECDLKIVAIDYCGNSMYQWLSNSNSGLDMYIQINEKNSTFTILENNLLALQRNMNFGAVTLTSALAYSGLYGKDITSADAMVRLTENDLLYHSFAEMEGAEPEDAEAQKLHLTKENLTESTRPFISNISRVLEYYHTRNREATVSKIYIGGIGARVQGLKALIESEFNGIEVEVVASLPGASFAKKNLIGQQRSTEFIACLGVSPATINFYKLGEQQKLEKTVIFCIVALVIVIIASIVIVLNGKSEYDSAMARQTTLQTQVAALEAQGIEMKEQEYYIARNKAIEIMEADESTFTYNEYWNEILADLESEGVSDMIVSSASSTESGLTLNIVVSSKAEAAKLLQKYSKITYFESVSISGITETVDNETGEKTVSFTLLCTYQHPEDSPYYVPDVTDDMAAKEVAE